MGGGEPGGQEAETRRLMSRVNWVRIYHAYFQSMVVEELPDLAYNALGEDAGFRAVAEITMKGSMRGFKVLHEEARKAGMDLSGLELREVLEYQVRCHRFAIEGMGVGFQLWERVEELEPGKRYALYTERCQYAERAKKNPVTCAVCVGFVAGILTQFGIPTRWVRRRERSRHLCGLPPEKRPRFFVYRDPGTPWPSCRLVIERLDCGPGEGGAGGGAPS